jgi:hypothetical protein
MNKSANDLIQELKEGKLSSFWISRNDDVPWADKITIVTKKQQSEIIDLFLDILKTKKIIKVPKNKHVKGFCKKGDTDLSEMFYDEIEEKNKDNDILVYIENDEYAGMTVLYPMERYKSSRWDIYVNLLCSVKKGTGTKIINLIKDAIKTNKKSGAIELSPLETAIEFYKKMGFRATRMIWVHNPNIKQDVQIEEYPKVVSGGYRKNGMKTLKLTHTKNAKVTSRNITQKSSKLI